jgi:hypothetical protein
MNDADLGLHLFKFAAPHLSLDDAQAVLEKLSALGYRLVAQNTPGEHVGYGMANLLVRNVPLTIGEAVAALSGLGRMGYRIEKPRKTK